MKTYDIKRTPYNYLICNTKNTTYVCVCVHLMHSRLVNRLLYSLSELEAKSLIQLVQAGERK